MNTMSLRVGKQNYVHDFIDYDKEGNVLKRYSWACNYILKTQCHPSGTHATETSLSVMYASEVPQAFEFFKYIFSKDYSPFRNVPSFELVKLCVDENGNPSSFLSTDNKKVNAHMFGSMVSACRLAYECPGSVTVFSEALKNGAEPHEAYAIADILSANVINDGMDINRLVLSKYYSGWHSVIGSSRENSSYRFLDWIKNPKLSSFSKEPLSKCASYDMSAPFVGGFNHRIIYNDFIYRKIEEKYVGIFSKMIEYNERHKDTSLYSYVPLKEIVQIIKAKGKE